MVPEVDKKDTEFMLNGLREQLETTRQEVLSWVLPKEQTSNDAEAQALRKLASRSAQQARQWTGRMLKELDTVYPYPHSQDSGSDVIDKTSVPQVKGYDLPAGFPVVRRVKHARMNLAAINADLNGLLAQCVPGSFFNQCLFRVQENAIQTAMWLGELLHEFYEAQPQAETFTLGTLAGIMEGVAANITPEQAQVVVEGNQHIPAFAEALAPGNETASTTTSSSTPTTPDSDPSTPDSPAPIPEASSSSISSPTPEPKGKTSAKPTRK